MLPTSCRVVVVPDARTPAGVSPVDSIPLADALRAPWFEHSMDAHITQYGKANGEACPRLKVCDMQQAIEDGVELHVALLDLDCPGHTPWSDGARGEDAIEALEEIIYRASKHQLPVGGYTSRAGLRLVLPLSPAVPLDKATGVLDALYHQVRQAVGDCTDVGVEWDDNANAQWSRLFRAPDVTRDGQTLRSYCVLPTGSYNPRAPHRQGEDRVPDGSCCG